MTNNTQNFDNIDFIRFLNRIILEEAFIMMTEGLPCDNKLEPGSRMKPDDENPARWSGDERERMAQRKITLHRHWRMWGKDTPATDVLGSIADNELKIEKQRPSAATAASAPPPLDERDVELMRDYADKHKPI